MKRKKLVVIFLTLSIILSLEFGAVMPQKTRATDYGLKNPVIDCSGVATWDCVYFGNYYQNDSTGTTKEPIKWRVLSVDGDNAFLVADQNLDAKQYNKSYEGVTWANSTLRSWLNGYDASCNVGNMDYSSDNFIDTAFSEEEKSAILWTDVVNEDNPRYDTKGGDDTSDQVYLLSIAEVSNVSYGFNSIFDMSSKTRVSTNTAYTSEKRGKYFDDAWWLRSPGYLSISASVIFTDGEGYYGDYGNAYYKSYAVRPALYLNLAFSDFWSYAGNVSSDGVSRPSVSEIPNVIPSSSPTQASIEVTAPNPVVTSIAKSTSAPMVKPTKTPSTNASEIPASLVPVFSNAPTSSTQVPTRVPAPNSVVTPIARSTFAPIVKPTKTPSSNASEISVSAVPALSTQVPTRMPAPNLVVTPTARSTSVPIVKSTKTPSINASEVPVPSNNPKLSTQAPTNVIQTSGPPMPASTICTGNLRESLISVPTEPCVTISAAPSLRDTVFASRTVTVKQTLCRGKIFRDVKTKAYYKILSVTATGGKVAYLRPTDRKVKKVIIKAIVIWKGKKFRVTQIGNKAFKDCKKMQKVIVGKNVSVVRKKTFENCKSLKVVILTGMKQKLSKNAFVGCPRKPKVRRKF